MPTFIYLYLFSFLLQEHRYITFYVIVPSHLLQLYSRYDTNCSRQWSMINVSVEKNVYVIHIFLHHQFCFTSSLDCERTLLRFALLRLENPRAQNLI